MSAPPRGLTSEQVLLIADALAEEFSCEVIDFSALAAIAGASTARFEGFGVFDTPEPLARHLMHITRRLSPLSAHNEEFARVLREVVLALNPD